MKFEKLLEKYRAVCTQRDELKAQLENRDEHIKDVCRHHEQTKNRIQEAVRLLLPQPKESDQVHQASGPGWLPRMGSPKRVIDTADREVKTLTICPSCGTRFEKEND